MKARRIATILAVLALAAGGFAAAAWAEGSGPGPGGGGSDNSGPGHGGTTTTETGDDRGHDGTTTTAAAPAPTTANVVPTATTVAPAPVAPVPVAAAGQRAPHVAGGATPRRNTARPATPAPAPRRRPVVRPPRPRHLHASVRETKRATKVQHAAQPAKDAALAIERRDPPPIATRIFAEPLARWILFVALGVVFVTALLLGAGVWAKRRVLKL